MVAYEELVENSLDRAGVTSNEALAELDDGSSDRSLFLLQRCLSVPFGTVCITNSNEDVVSPSSLDDNRFYGFNVRAHPLTAPAVRPLTRCLCRKMKRIS